MIKDDIIFRLKEAQLLLKELDFIEHACILLISIISPTFLSMESNLVGSEKETLNNTCFIKKKPLC